MWELTFFWTAVRDSFSALTIAIWALTLFIASADNCCAPAAEIQIVVTETNATDRRQIITLRDIPPDPFFMAYHLFLSDFIH
jgi:hypothetical protein